MKTEIINVDQGSEEWLKLKLGVISASCVYDILPSEKTKKYKEARENYLLKLVGEIATGHQEELNAKALEWGKANEDAARAAYEFTMGAAVEKAGFIYGEGRRFGCSPDALVIGKEKGIEIKCPMTAAVHVDFLNSEYIKPEYLAQIQFSLWVTGFMAWDFVSYHPRFKSNMIKVVTIERDAECMARFDEEIPKFISEMDKVLARLGLTFGQQWI